MQINIDCLRDILIYCEENIDYNYDIDDRPSLTGVSLYQLCHSNLINKYERKEIMYSIMKLEEIHFIIISDRFPSDRSIIERCTIAEITYRGHQFLDTIKPESIWEKTKGVVKNIGNHTLNFIEGTAHDIAVESAKQAVTVIMTQNKA